MTIAFTSSLPLPLSHISNSPSVCKRPRTIPKLTLAPPPHPESISTNPNPVFYPPPLLGREALDTALRFEDVTVVLFHARWCRVCKTLLSKLPRVAHNYPHIRWLRMDLAEDGNRGLNKELGVKLLPTVRVYCQGVLKEEFTTGPFGVRRLEERIQPYVE